MCVGGEARKGFHPKDSNGFRVGRDDWDCALTRVMANRRDTHLFMCSFDYRTCHSKREKIMNRDKNGALNLASHS